MTVPASAITFSSIQSEFGGSNPINLSEYYGGNGLVPTGITGSGAVPATGTPLTVSAFSNNGFRGIAAGGFTAGSVAQANAQYFNIMGIALSSFGTLGTARWGAYAFGSPTRFQICGGNSGVADLLNSESSLFANTGTFAAFGAISVTVLYSGTGSNKTRGINFGGFSTTTGYDRSSYIGYKDLTTSGAGASFGLLNVERSDSYTHASTPTRSFAILGGTSSGAVVTSIEWVTTATLGNATVFGFTDTSRTYHAGCCSSTREVYAGGADTGGLVNTIRYFDMAAMTATAAFGNLTQARYEVCGLSGGTRGIYVGGYNTNPLTTIDYINIASTGNATSFGSLPAARAGMRANSNGHGGLM